MPAKREPTVLYQISFPFPDSPGKCSFRCCLNSRTTKRWPMRAQTNIHTALLIEAFSILKLPVYVCPAQNKIVCCCAHCSLTNDWQKRHFWSNRHFLICLGCTFAQIANAFILHFQCCLSPERWKTCSICFSFSIQALSPSTLTQFPFAHLLWYLSLIVFESHWHHLIKYRIPCVLLSSGLSHELLSSTYFYIHFIFFQRTVAIICSFCAWIFLGA